ncbi:tripartite tricarboxylate transporter substrate binding protein [Roseomonas terrae]|uniref:Tripartite tricarboxylate transporter substrate binding protein n=1 Tax=Neoroseomonas terrae TaxID=424799 RepID=A0ABS5EQ72_9PROT|nr:tripartite tricarboxylate transporter substrate binding protein [Neoroseomonas terrae]MBR0653186.1 tripartite tricarboxylate transporter substrate binding protein [Neoroseomonas terrae]
MTEWPTRPIRVVVPFQAGSATDTMMRVLGPRMAQTLGEAIVIDNRPGAGGVTGSEIVARAPRDGYTLLMAAASSHGILPAMMPRIPYDAVQDFTPIGLACSSTNFIVVHPSLPVHNLQELIAYAKAQPQGLSYAAGSRGSSNGLAGEILTLRSGAPLTHIPYNNIAQGVSDTLAGHVKMMIYTVAILPHVREGRLRTIAVTAARRQVQAPDVPTAVEQGAEGVIADSWFAMFGPAGLPDATRDRASGALREALADPQIAQRLIEQGLTPAYLGPDELRSYVQAEIGKWTGVSRAIGLRLD